MKNEERHETTPCDNVMRHDVPCAWVIDERRIHGWMYGIIIWRDAYTGGL